MPTFTDNQNRIWNIEITSDGVDRVQSLVKTPDGAAVDLFAAAETGKFDVLKNLKTLTQTVFVLCLSEILEEFDVAAYDAANADIYEMIPERAAERKVQKASRWFSSAITGSVLESMTDALMQAIINFTASPARRDAIRTILDQERKLETLYAQRFKEKIVEKAEFLETTLDVQIDSAFNQEQPES